MAHIWRQHPATAPASRHHNMHLPAAPCSSTSTKAPKGTQAPFPELEVRTPIALAIWGIDLRYRSGTNTQALKHTWHTSGGSTLRRHQHPGIIICICQRLPAAAPALRLQSAHGHTHLFSNVHTGMDSSTSTTQAPLPILDGRTPIDPAIWRKMDGA